MTKDLNELIQTERDFQRSYDDGNIFEEPVKKEPQQKKESFPYIGDLNASAVGLTYIINRLKTSAINVYQSFRK